MRQEILTYTNLLILITVIVSFVAYDRKNLLDALKFHPYSIKRNPKELIRFITVTAVHADIFHLFFNMYVMYTFGNKIEATFKHDFETRGLFYYSLLYFGGAMFAGLPGYFRHKDNIGYAAVGASGAISALVFAFIIIHPEARLGLIFLPVYAPAVIFGLVYLAVEFYLDRRGGTGVAHDAHFWGALFGICFILLIRTEYAQHFFYYLKHAF